MAAKISKRERRLQPGDFATRVLPEDGKQDRLQGGGDLLQCGAFASNGHDTGWSEAPTKTEAESGAIKTCGESDCKLVTSGCN